MSDWRIAHRNGNQDPRARRPGRHPSPARAARLSVIRPRVFESNTLYDTPGHSLRQRGELIRIRRSGRTHAPDLQVRGPAGPPQAPRGIRNEVADAGAIEAILSPGPRRGIPLRKVPDGISADPAEGIACWTRRQSASFSNSRAARTGSMTAARELGFAEIGLHPVELRRAVSRTLPSERVRARRHGVPAAGLTRPHHLRRRKPFPE